MREMISTSIRECCSSIKHSVYSLDLYINAGGHASPYSMSVTDLQEAEKVLRELAHELSERRGQLLANARRPAA